MNDTNSRSMPIARVMWMFLPVALIVLYLIRQSFTGPLGTDTSMFLTGAHIFTSGQGAHLYDVALETNVQAGLDPLATSAFGLLPFNYPPFVAVFFAPLSIFPVDQAYLIWVIVLWGALIGLAGWVAFYFRKQYGFVPKPAIIAIFSFAPVFEIFLWGQMSLIMLGLWWWAYISWRHEKWGQLGVAVALSAFKPHLAVVLLVGLVAQKRWRALGYTVATQAVLWGATMLLLGPGILQSYLGMLQVSSSTFGTLGFLGDKMLNLRGLVSIAGASPQISIQIALVFWVASIGAAIWVWRRPWSLAARFGVATTLAVLFSPHLYVHDASLLLVPIICVSLVHLERHKTPNYRWLLAMLSAVFIGYYSSLLLHSWLSDSWAPIIIIMWIFCLLILAWLVRVEVSADVTTVQDVKMSGLTRAQPEVS